ncbi:glycosyltransferase [Priestia megaterium]|uniref:glycosyltransferase n=1 Tax=Priestia megaterium TaxID=1404 RepID=UPI003F814FAA
MKKKLAIVVPSMRGGGAERVVLNIVSNLDREKYDIRLILIKKEGPYVKFLPQDITIVDLNSSRVRNSIIKLIKELNRFKPHTILSTLGHLNLVILGIRGLLKSRPNIIVREANTPSVNLNGLSPIKRTLMLFLYRSLYPKAHTIIAQCKSMKDDITSFFHISKDKVIHIYNPLDLEKINANKSIEENPYNADNINILAVGRLTHQKGFDILLEAFKVVTKQVPNTHLTILGEGGLKEDLLRKVEELNIAKQVSIVDFKSNPYPYYYYADTYVLSSRWEGFPNTLLEALACGTKVVAIDCKSGPKEILQDNKYGILVEELGAAPLATGILNSIFGENLSQDRAHYYSIKRIIKEYEQTL